MVSGLTDVTMAFWDRLGRQLTASIAYRQEVDLQLALWSPGAGCVQCGTVYLRRGWYARHLLRKCRKPNLGASELT